MDPQDAYVRCIWILECIFEKKCGLFGLAGFFELIHISLGMMLVSSGSYGLKFY